MTNPERQDTIEARETNIKRAEILLDSIRGKLTEITDPVNAECLVLNLEEILESL